MQPPLGVCIQDRAATSVWRRSHAVVRIPVYGVRSFVRGAGARIHRHRRGQLPEMWQRSRPSQGLNLCLEGERGRQCRRACKFVCAQRRLRDSPLGRPWAGTRFREDRAHEPGLALALRGCRRNTVPQKASRAMPATPFALLSLSPSVPYSTALVVTANFGGFSRCFLTAHCSAERITASLYFSGKSDGSWMSSDILATM